MTIQETIKGIAEQAKERNWTTELFEQIKVSLNYVNVFRFLRQELPPKEYEQLDFLYSAYIRPDQKEVNKFLMKRSEEERWKQEKARLLREKRKLLLQK